MKMMANDGSTLDAEFRSSLTNSGFDVVVESRGGAKRQRPTKNPGQRPARNPDYNELLLLLLQRVSRIDAVIRVATVDSARTRKLPISDRTIRSDRLSYPITVEKGTDFGSLRLDLTKPQAAIGRVPGAKGRGNPSKKIRISFDWNWRRLRVEDLEQLLVEGKLDEVIPVQKDPDPRGGSSVLDGWNQKISLYEGASPRTTERLRKSIERGSVGEQVKKKAGHQCQICEAIGMVPRTFRTNAGRDYVEAHHVVPVSSGQAGTLSPANVISVCASHHRELHYGKIASASDLGTAFRIVVEGGTAIVPKNFQVEERSVLRPAPAGGGDGGHVTS